MAPVSSMGQRRRNSYLSLEHGRASAKKILEVKAAGLLNVKQVTLLPYPGIGSPPDRPASELYYVGTRDMMEILRLFCEPVRRLVIEGPRGFGKSSDLRALSVYVYVAFYWSNRKDVVVCIWNMTAAISDVHSVVRDALLFAYLVLLEGEKLRAAAAAGPSTSASTSTAAGPSTSTSTSTAAAAAGTSTSASTSTDTSQQVTEFENVLQTIQSLESVDAAIQFIRRRKKENQEKFHFFVDGWELIDVTDSAGVDQPRLNERTLVYQKLEHLFTEGEHVFFSASAKSIAVKPSSREFVYHKDKPFDDDQCKSYASRSILGKLASREKDIDFYTGRVPLFLDVLCDCCTEFSRLQAATARNNMEMELLKMEPVQMDLVEQTFHKVQAVVTEREDVIVELLQDDDNWQMVLKLFREHEEVKRLEDSMKKIKLDRSYHSIEEMGEKDPTYFIVKENRYCSSFVHRMYVKDFRAKEAQLKIHAGGAWIPYCSYLLKHRQVNWSDVGWVVEDLVADVVTTRDVYFGKTLGKIAAARLKLEEFTEIPKLQIEELAKTAPGSGYYWKPRLYNFPYIDGVIFYVDMQKNLHILGLQVTVSVDKHHLSARLFMSNQNLKTWFPDLDAAKNVQLHFVYVGCSEENKGEVEKTIKAEVHNLKNGKSYGMEEHKWTYVPLAEALVSLGTDERKVVQDIADKRQLQVPTWPLEMAALYPLKRSELNEIAVRYSLDPKRYSKKEDLITALAELI